MPNQENILVQKITLFRNGEAYADFDLSFLQDLTYVETLDLSGPRLMFSINDPWRLFRDDIGVKEKDVLQVTLSDQFGFDGLDKIIYFVILTMPIDGDILSFNCLEATVWKLKQPAKGAMLFNKQPIKSILSRLAPGLKYDVGTFQVLNDYHLLPGMRPSKMIREMAREHGAVCFWQRGKIVFKKLKDLYAVTPAMTYYHNDSRQQYKIAVYSRPNTQAVIKDRTERNYVGWDMVEGIQKNKAVKAPAEFVSASNVASLDGLLEIPLPSIDFTTHGNGTLVPGLTIGLSWAVDRIDAPIDESLPKKVVVGTVSHFQSNQVYACRVLGVK